MAFRMKLAMLTIRIAMVAPTGCSVSVDTNIPNAPSAASASPR